MIINEQKNDVRVSGDFKTSGFRIQANSKAFDILSSNIYTHKVRAVVREISCNAADAHKAANNNDPFDVHLPTTLEPYFSVRDYGIGLSDEDVREIFTTYFCSTKTNSNDFIGALGLGSKSPFCIVDSFTVKSFYNGTVRLYSCYRDENGEPQVALLTESETSEYNGVEVSMTVENDMISQFKHDAKDVYFYFDKIPNINDKFVAEEIQSRKDRCIINDDLMCIERINNWGDIKAVMGGVSYSIPSEVDTLKAFDGFVRFDMGEISFDAGRESLSLDKKTIEAIKSKLETVKNRLHDRAISLIESQATDFAKIKMAQEVMGLSYVDSKKIREKYPVPKCDKIQYFSRSYRSTDQGTTDYLPLGNNVEYYRYKPKFTNRIKNYLKQQSKLTIVLLTDEQITSTNIDLSELKDLDTLPKVEYASNSSGYVNRGNVYTYDKHNSSWKNSNKWNDCSSYDVNEEKVYTIITRWEPQDSFSTLNIVSKTATVYGIKNAFKNTKAFKSGKWISVEEYLKREFSQKLNDLVKYEMPNSWEDSDIMHTLCNISSKTNCEIIKKLNGILKLMNSEKNEDLFHVANMFHWPLKKDNTILSLVEEIKIKYPMISLIKTNIDKAKINVLCEYINERS